MRERNAELAPEREHLIQALNPGDEAIILDLDVCHVDSSNFVGARLILTA